MLSLHPQQIVTPPQTTIPSSPIDPRTSLPVVSCAEVSYYHRFWQLLAARERKLIQKHSFVSIPVSNSPGRA